MIMVTGLIIISVVLVLVNVIIFYSYRNLSANYNRMNILIAIILKSLQELECTDGTEHK